MGLIRWPSLKRPRTAPGGQRRAAARDLTRYPPRQALAARTELAGACVAYPGGIPHICDAFELGSAEVMAVGFVQEGVQNAASVPGPDRFARAR